MHPVLRNILCEYGLCSAPLIRKTTFPLVPLHNHSQQFFAIFLYHKDTESENAGISVFRELPLASITHIFQIGITMLPHRAFGILDSPLTATFSSIVKILIPSASVFSHSICFIFSPLIGSSSFNLF